MRLSNPETSHEKKEGSQGQYGCQYMPDPHARIHQGPETDSQSSSRNQSSQ